MGLQWCWRRRWAGKLLWRRRRHWPPGSQGMLAVGAAPVAVGSDSLPDGVCLGFVKWIHSIPPFSIAMQQAVIGSEKKPLF